MNNRTAPKANAEAVEKYLGKRATIEIVQGFEVNVLITDVKFRYGHTDVVIIPEAGEGSIPVVATRIKLKD